MKRKSALLSLGMFIALFFVVGSGIQAAEIVYIEDIKENVITTSHLVRTADNVIVMLDTSGSMDLVHKTLQKANYDLEREAITTGVRRLPDLGYNIGIYRFTPWEVLYPMQKFNEAKVLDALKKLPEKARGMSPLLQGLDQLDSVLKGLKGKTFVYLFSDGGYDTEGPNRTYLTATPGEKTAALAKKYNVCFQVIDYSEAGADRKDKETIQDMAKVNRCSRVLPFDAYVSNPYYGIGPLFYVKWDTQVVTTSSKRVGGYKVKNIYFEVNKFDVPAAGQDELNALGKFMAEKPNAYTVLFGFTDDTGKAEYQYGALPPQVRGGSTLPIR